MRMLEVFLCLFYFLVGAVCFSFHFGSHGSRITTFERFDGTCGNRLLPIVFNYQGMKSDGKKLWMNCSSTVKEDIIKNPTLIIHLERCKNRENLDTCEHFYDIRKEKSCVLFDKHNPLWGPFFTAFEPEFKCPVEKAVYRAQNGELDLSAFLLFPQEAWFWKVRAELREPETERLLMCILVEAHIATKP